MKFQLVSGLLLLGASGFITPPFHLANGGLFSTLTKTNNTIEEALKELATDTKTKPLVIPFLGADATAPANKPAVRDKIRAAIAKRNPQVLTVAVIMHIFPKNTPLSPGTVIKLKTDYSGDMWEGALLFYIKENTKQTQAVCDALQKINQKNPLILNYLTADATAPASNPTVVAKLRVALQKRNKIFTQTVVNDIEFSNTPLNPGHKVAVTATYQA